MHELIIRKGKYYNLKVLLVFLLFLPISIQSFSQDSNSQNISPGSDTPQATANEELTEPSLQPQESNYDRDIALIRAKLEDLEGRVDAYDYGIGELSLEMGMLLSEKGDAEGALAALRRSLHVSRINNGLDSTLQLPVLEATLEVQTKANLFDAAGDTLSRIYLVHTQNYLPNDPATIELLRRIGLWHFSAYYYDIDKKGISHLLDARRALGLAHDMSLEADLGYDFDLYNVLAMTDHGLALFASSTGANTGNAPASAEFGSKPSQADQINPGMITGSYRRGKILLETGLEEAIKSENVENTVRAMLLYADWNQLFNKRHAAQKLYLKAYQAVQSLPEENALRASFNRPHRLPDFNGNTLEFGPVEKEVQLVSVKFKVNKWGASSDIKILPKDDDEEIRHTVKRAATKTVRSAMYRPAIANGQPIDSLDVTQNVIVEL